MADASLQIKVDAGDVKNATDQLDRLAVAGKKTEGAIDGLTDSLAKEHPYWGQMISSTKKADASLSGVSGSAKKAGDGLSHAAAGAGAAGTAFSNTSQAAGNTGSAFNNAGNSARNFRGIAQSLGYQMQDTAVQLQMGTSALVVLGQQGSQMASAFGPTGAVVGAILAVGSAIAGVALNSRNASKAVEQLEKDLESLTKSQAQQGLLELAKADADLNKKLSEMEGRRKALSVAEQVGGQTKDQLRDITLKLNAEEEAAKAGLQKNADLRKALTGITQGQSKSIQDFVKDLDYETKLVNASAVETALLNAERDRGRPLTEAEAAAVRKSAQALEAENRKKAEAEAAEKSLIEVRKEGVKQIRFDDMRRVRAEAYLETVQRQAMTEQQIVSNDYSIKLAKLDEYLAQKAITQQEYDAAELASREAYVDQMAALDTKQTDNAVKEAERLAQAKKQIDDTIIGNTQFMLQATTDMIRDSGAENNTFMKMLLAAQKALAIPSIMASTETAAAAAMAHETVLGGMMSGQMAANMIRAQGAISMGIVAGQAFAGMFDKGGNIPSGQWGIVGEYGPEIVKGPANVTSRKDTAAMARGAMSGGGGGGLTIIQHFHMTEAYGNEAIYNIVGESAKKSVQEAYNKVRHDFATNGSIRRTAGV